jgi:hypothetical protein
LPTAPWRFESSLYSDPDIAIKALLLRGFFILYSGMRYLSAVILLTSLAIAITYKLREHPIVVEIGKIDRLLAPVKPKIGASSCISFDCNVQGMRGSEFYFKTAFVLAPAIVTDRLDRDTLLAITSLSDTASPKVYRGYRVLDTGMADNYKFALMALMK